MAIPFLASVGRQRRGNGGSDKDGNANGSSKSVTGASSANHTARRGDKPSGKSNECVYVVARAGRIWLEELGVIDSHTTLDPLHARCTEMRHRVVG